MQHNYNKRYILSYFLGSFKIPPRVCVLINVHSLLLDGQLKVQPAAEGG